MIAGDLPVRPRVASDLPHGSFRQLRFIVQLTEATVNLPADPGLPFRRDGKMPGICAKFVATGLEHPQVGFGRNVGIVQPPTDIVGKAGTLRDTDLAVAAFRRRAIPTPTRKWIGRYDDLAVEPRPQGIVGASI